LWYLNAIYKYYLYTADKLFIKAMVPALREVIEWHYRGTRYNIKVDPDDELLAGGHPGIQLTWMDAKMGDWVVTPRSGKAVEVNALWYNALRIMQTLLEELNYHGDAELYQLKCSKVYESFNNAFWNPKTGCLYDYIDGGFQCEDIRPNQVYAMSLPFPVLEQNRSGSVIRVIHDQLATPRGLRSLSPLHSDYRPRYEGDLRSRDAVYHQGPVWSHLAGAYIDAMFFVDDEDARQGAQDYFDEVVQTLDEAGLGSISELFDGDEPHTPRGCFAQAWSVGELLRVGYEHNLLKFPKKQTLRKTSLEAMK
jgi:predicted glycogen debranching enzyme